MSEYKVKILGVEPVTHDVKQFTIERPSGYTFQPGQATDVAINQPGREHEKRPFTFTGLAPSGHLEFIIKIYPDHDGVTKQLGQLKAGDELLIHDPWGAIEYKGKGVFIAGGAGITPFIAIFRHLSNNKEINGHQLIFSNKTAKDIILREELENMLGDQFINVVTDERIPGIRHQRIDKAYLSEVISDFTQHFYICGPDKFTLAIKNYLSELGADADAIVFEK